MTEAQRAVLLHTLGLNMVPRGKPPRNYFNSHPDDSDFGDCAALVEMGLMRRGRSETDWSIYFHATAEGVQAAVGLAVPMAEIEEWLTTRKWPEKQKQTLRD